jgi:hypothetical protein
MIPFLFVLAVVYGALDFAEVFKKNSVKGIIALAMAFFAISSPPVISFIDSILPYAVILFIIVFFLAFLKKLVSRGGKGGGEKKPFKDWSLLAIVVVLLAIFLADQGSGLLGTYLPSATTTELLYGAGLVLILLILYAAYKNWNDDGGK